VSETNEMGQIGISSGGILTFATASNTKLTQGNDEIIIASGGELRVGNSSTRVGAAYTAELIWNTTTDNADGINVASGGVLNIYGDPAYYGSDDETALADNAENTDGDTVIITKQDMSALWNNGDEITIKIEGDGDSTSRQDAIVLGVIQSISGTSITLDITITAATGVGNTWESPVINVTRNVKLYKLGASTAIANYNSARPRLYDVNASGNNNCNVDNAMLTGFYSIDSNYDFSFTNSIFRNGNWGFNAGTNHSISGNVYSNDRGFNSGTNYTVSGNVYSNTYGFYAGTNHTISGDVYSNNYGFNNGTNHTISGNVHSNNYGFNNDTNYTVSGNVYSNARGFNYGINHTVSGKIGYNDADVSSPNTSFDFSFAGYTKHTLRAAKLPLSGLVFSSRSDIGEDGGIFSEDHSQVVDASYTYLPHGDIVKNTTTTRAGGADNSLEVIPLSTVTDKDFIRAFEWVEFDVPASSQTRSIYIKGEGWTSWPTNTELYLEAEYYGAASGVTKTIIASTAVLTDNTTWTQFSVTFTPGQVGKVRYRAFLKKYESASKIYIDNQLV